MDTPNMVGPPTGFGPLRRAMPVDVGVGRRGSGASGVSAVAKECGNRKLGLLAANDRFLFKTLIRGLGNSSGRRFNKKEW